MGPAGIREWTYDAGAAITGSPTVGADGTVYIASLAPKLHAVGGDGKEKWTYPLTAISNAAPATPRIEPCRVQRPNWAAALVFRRNGWARAVHELPRRLTGR